MVEASEPLPRPMKYPYTYTAKFMQFPIKYYFTNQWVWRWYAGGFLLSLPIFYKIHKLANSPENVRAAADKKIKEAAEHH